jgi:hypothetical protein
VCGFLLRRTRDPHLAEDLAQETFVKATRALLGWRGENAAAWLLTIARNVLVDHFRRHRRELALPHPVAAQPMRAFGGFIAGYGGAEHVVTQDFFGRVGRLPLGNYANTTLSMALFNVGTGNQPKESSRKVLARLPEGLNALSVIEFAKPLTTEELIAFTARHKSHADKVVFERRPGSTPITWGGLEMWDRAPAPRTAPGEDHVIGPDEAIKLNLANFRGWVGILEDYDDDNLHDFDLSLARLRKAATDGLAYAYVDSMSTIGELRKIIEDPLVRTVRVADLTYDLGGS